MEANKQAQSCVLIIDQGSTSIHVGLNSDKKPSLSFKAPFYYLCKEDNEIRFGQEDYEFALEKEPYKIYRIFHEDGKVTAPTTCLFTSTRSEIGPTGPSS